MQTPHVDVLATCCVDIIYLVLRELLDEDVLSLSSTSHHYYLATLSYMLDRAKGRAGIASRSLFVKYARAGEPCLYSEEGYKVLNSILARRDITKVRATRFVMAVINVNKKCWVGSISARTPLGPIAKQYRNVDDILLPLNANEASCIILSKRTILIAQGADIAETPYKNVDKLVWAGWHTTVEGMKILCHYRFIFQTGEKIVFNHLDRCLYADGDIYTTRSGSITFSYENQTYTYDNGVCQQAPIACKKLVYVDNFLVCLSDRESVQDSPVCLSNEERVQDHIIVLSTRTVKDITVYKQSIVILYRDGRLTLRNVHTEVEKPVDIQVISIMGEHEHVDYLCYIRKV